MPTLHSTATTRASALSDELETGAGKITLNPEPDASSQTTSRDALSHGNHEKEDYLAVDLKERTTRSGKRENRTAKKSRHKAKVDSVTQRGRDKLLKMLKEAEFEADVDPYRGIFAKDSNRTNPWSSCIPVEMKSGTAHGDGRDVQQLDEQVDAVLLGTSKCKIACPSLVKWRQEALNTREKEAAGARKKAEKAKKGTSKKTLSSIKSTEKQDVPILVEVETDPQPECFMLGSRSELYSYQCNCDFNPLCLASLGGAMDDFLFGVANSDKMNFQANSWIGVNEHFVPIKQSPERGYHARSDMSNAGKVGNSEEHIPSLAPANKTHTSEPIDEITDDVPSKDRTQSQNSRTYQTNEEVHANLSPGTGSNEMELLSSEHHSKIYGEDTVASAMCNDSTVESSAPVVTPLVDGTETLDEYDIAILTKKVDFDDIREEVSTPKTHQTTPHTQRIEKDDLMSYKGRDEPIPPEISNILQLRKRVDNFEWQRSQESAALRVPVSVKLSLIQAFTEGYIIPAHDNNVTRLIEDYIDHVKQWHSSLLWSSPASIGDLKNDRETVKLSRPPGMKNLGATCYLNSQLQCLAQNLAFIRGVFSWNGDDMDRSSSLNNMLSEMQALLGRMVHGPDNCVATDDFSTALGLETNEMQDPNEFAKLLFERMNETFKKGSSQGLLPTLFGGHYTYKTTCLKCSGVSKRQESFMDLTLPIVDGTEITPSNGKGSKRTKLLDTDVQKCLETFLEHERLTGDNLYLCEQCKSKQEAERRLTLTKLPPVLNVQLTRYVFDMKLFSKRKVTNLVKLPRILSVPLTNEGAFQTNHPDSIDSIYSKEYILCAVLNHQGTSAHGGHYVAEAMEWTTGNWYEFNDELVTLLPGGPGHSFYPDSCGMDSDRYDFPLSLTSNVAPIKPTPVRGSSDAYNMFYVERSYLTECAKDQISTMCQKRQKDSSINDETYFLDTIANERRERYYAKTKSSNQLHKKIERMKRRRNGILQNMLGVNCRKEASSDVDDSTSGSAVSRSSVWVDSDLLSRFFSCSDGLENYLLGTGPILRHKHLLCAHNKLHPRTFRRGKLLDRAAYDAYVALLLSEREQLLFDHADPTQTEYIDELNIMNANDCIITPESNLCCQECASLYSTELKEKCNKLRLMIDIHDALETDTNIDNETQEVYALSKKFATSFKSSISRMMKSTVQINAKPTNVVLALSEESLYAGLDALSLDFLNSVETESSNSKGDHTLLNRVENEPTNLDPIIELKDDIVNNNITCPHGNSNVLRNKSLVRYIPYSTWEKLKSLYPTAICHSRSAQSMKYPPSDIDCLTCARAHDKQATFLRKVDEWAKQCYDRSGRLYNLYRRGLSGDTNHYPTDLASSECHSGHSCVLIYQDDIKKWRSTVKFIFDHRKKKNSKSLDDTLHKALNAMFFGEDSGPESVHTWKWRSLLCKEHQNLAINPIDLLRSSQGKIEILKDSEHNDLVKSVSSLKRILLSSAEDSLDDGNGADIDLLLKEYHPSLTLSLDHATQLGTNISTPSLSSKFQIGQVSHHVCSNKACLEDFLFDKSSCGQTSESLKSTESGPILFVNANAPSSDQPSSGHLHENINPATPLNSEILQEEAKLFVRIYSTYGSKTIEDAATEILSKYLTIDNDVTGTRRSTRKRQTRSLPGSNSSCKELHVGRDTNLACIRLTLYQDHNERLVDQELVLVLPLAQIHSSEMNGAEMEDPHPFTLSLSNADNSLSMDEIIEKAKSKAKAHDLIVDCDPTAPVLHLLLRYPLTKKRKKEDGIQTDEIILDSLMEISSFSSICDSGDQASGKKRKKGRQRRTERGFSGTFLQSSSIVSTNLDAPPGSGSNESDHSQPHTNVVPLYENGLVSETSSIIEICNTP